MPDDQKRSLLGTVGELKHSFLQAIHLEPHDTSSSVDSPTLSATPTATPTLSEPSHMSFISIMDAVGRDVKLAYTDVVKYLPTAAALAETIFVGQTGKITGVVNAVGLIQQAVVLVEQKFAAIGTPTGTGTQKSAQVLTIVGPIVTQLFVAEGISFNATTVQNVINGVVAILNVNSPLAAVTA